ncbi:tetratricopeptide repeat protein [Rufibacter radiotolerans]|uniref:tetratricopeptide repeat protein n=1 Tax=Rufibacter radiotolerans TaxID=1379910 RepID=UPI0009E311C5|nr:tetratricopeptide repeat protein [Rufibacter radiotolerans]
MSKNWKTYGVLAAALFVSAGASATNVGLGSGKTTAAVHAYLEQNILATNLVQDNSALGLVKQGKAALQQNKTAEAQQHFDKALAMTKSKDNNVKVAIAEAYVSTGVKDLSPAIKLLEEVVSKDQKNANTFILLGEAYLNNKTVDGGKALANFDKALNLEPKNARALYSKGKLYVQSRNYKSAGENLEAAVAADPKFAPSYLELAELYYLAKQFPKSSEYITKYISLAENTPETRAKYASILYLTKDYTNAMTEIQNVLKVDPNNVAMNRLLAYSYFDTKQYDKALEAMKSYFAKYDETKRIPSDYEYYANILVENKKPQEAVDLILKAKQLDPKNPIYDDLLAKQYLSLKDYPKAIEAYKAKFAVTPPSNTDLFYYGYTYELNDNYKTADSVYAIITTTNPTYAYGHLWRARVNSNLDPDTKLGLAKPHYEEFIKLTSGDKEKYKKDLITANNYLGYFYYLKKDKANATKYWTEVKALDPTNADATNGLNGLKSMK